MRAALAHPDTSVRRRALSAMAKLEVPHFARDFLLKLDHHLERDLGLAHIREALAVMNASAREKIAGELGPILERQMASIRDAIDMQTRTRLEEIRVNAEARLACAAGNARSTSGSSRTADMDSTDSPANRRGRCRPPTWPTRRAA